MSRIAVIGGSGFNQLPGLVALGEENPDTPFGQPTAPIQRGRLADAELLFLSRHGLNHRIPPHRVNYRANLWALKQLGAERVVGLAAVGGIQAPYAPRVLAVPAHLVDYTHGREQTFHAGGDSGVVHIDFTWPYCEPLRAELLRLGRALGIDLVDGGTLGVTQGPRLETRAEIARLRKELERTRMERDILRASNETCFGALGLAWQSPLSPMTSGRRSRRCCRRSGRSRKVAARACPTVLR